MKKTKTLHTKFLEVSRMSWNKKMSSDAHTGLELTYGTGAVAVKMLSGLLKSKTDKKYIGILFPSCGGNLIAMLGTLFSGKIPVMINYSTGVSGNIALAREKCHIDLVLTSRKFMEKLGVETTSEMLFLEDVISSFSLRKKIVSLVQVRFLPFSWFLSLNNLKEDPNEICVILFTSGSEKKPKAVQLSHNNLTSNISSISECIPTSSNDVILGTLPIFHSFGFLVALWALCNSVKIVFYPNPLDYKTIGETAKKFRPTIMLGTPVFYEGYISKCHKDDFNSIRIAISGGDKLFERTRLGFLEKFGVEILQGYGITESSAAATCNSPEESRSGSLGKPLPGMEIKIINPETGKDIPSNQDGMILLKGETIMPGYLGDEEKTKEVIKDSWYYTGDIGRLDNEGFLWFSGRLKRFVKIGGEMISLTAVESAILECIPKECECAVIGVEDEKRGSKIEAFVTGDKNIILSIRNQLKKHLPAIAIPKKFHSVKEIPKLGTGKPNFQELPKLIQKHSTANTK